MNLHFITTLGLTYGVVLGINYWSSKMNKINKPTKKDIIEHSIEINLLVVCICFYWTSKK